MDTRSRAKAAKSYTPGRAGLQFDQITDWEEEQDRIS